MNHSASSPLSGIDVPIGVGLKNQHFSDVLQKKPDLAFFEVHAENFMSSGGAHHRYLEEITQDYPLSVHGVGLSLGSADGLNAKHLQCFKDLVERYEPALISEHLSWSVEGGYYLNDLLPLPLNHESLSVVVDNIKQVQDIVGRQLLVENPSAYMALVDTDIPEPEFLAKLVQQTGCGLLLDVNNVFVSGSNMGWDTGLYLDYIPAEAVGEIHLAGHTVKDINGTVFRIDDHGSAVSGEVWGYFEQLVNRIGARPTLIEWDNDIPAFDELMTEAQKARVIMQSLMREAHCG